MNMFWILLPIIILLIVIFLSIPKGSSRQSPPSSHSVDYGESFSDIRNERKRIAKQNYETHERSSRENQKRKRSSQLRDRPAIDYRHTPKLSSYSSGRYNTNQIDDGNTITVYPEDVPPQIGDGR